MEQDPSWVRIHGLREVMQMPGPLCTVRFSVSGASGSRCLNFGADVLGPGSTKQETWRAVRCESGARLWRDDLFQRQTSICIARGLETGQTNTSLALCFRQVFVGVRCLTGENATPAAKRVSANPLLPYKMARHSPQSPTLAPKPKRPILQRNS